GAVRITRASITTSLIVLSRTVLSFSGLMHLRRHKDRCSLSDEAERSPRLSGGSGGQLARRSWSPLEPRVGRRLAPGDARPKAAGSVGAARSVRANAGGEPRPKAAAQRRLLGVGSSAVLDRGIALSAQALLYVLGSHSQLFLGRIRAPPFEDHLGSN